MSGLQFVPFVPTYIPPQLCQSVGIEIKPGDSTDACMDIVRTNVAESAVSVPVGTAPEVEAQLEQVVADADSQGIDLKIVVMDASPPIHTPLRVLRRSGEVNPGATVLVVSQASPGPIVPCSTGRRWRRRGSRQDRRSGALVEEFRRRVDGIPFPWTPFTIVLVLAVALAVVATRVLQKWGKRSAVHQAASTSSD